MNKFFKILLAIVLAILFVLLGVIVYLNSSVRNPSSGDLRLQGLHSKVIIVRDRYGVPHIQSKVSDNDVFFALGYVHAQDRFWQMELHRRVTQGTLSEIFGSATLGQDKYLRTWGFYRAAKKDLLSFDYRTRKILHSYTKGVNAFLATGNLPLQFKLLKYKPKPWTDVDTIAWQKMLAWDLQDSWEQKVKNYLIAKHYGKKWVSIFLPPYPENAPTVLSKKDIKKSGLMGNYYYIHHHKKFRSSYDSMIQNLRETRKVRTFFGFQNLPGKGSNNWVLSGRFTESGKPILANDPHLALEAPSVWYLAELEGPHFHVIGATMPGTPGVIIGHNENIAWGVTNVDPDTQDIYIEPKNARLKTIFEIIKVKGKPDVHFVVHESIHGPIISHVTEAGKISKSVALKWTALIPGDTTIQSFIDLNYAKDWRGFVNALKYYVAPAQNFVYADIKGNIGYYMPGRIPYRKGWSGAYPVEPYQHHEWSGYIPFSRLPHVYNPPEGFIATANNKVVTKDYPYSISFRWKVPPYRIIRINDLIKEGEKFTVDKVKDMQLDTISYLWQDLSEKLLETKPLDEASETALEMLKDWNGNMSLTSTAATIFAYWYRELGRITPVLIRNKHGHPQPLFLKHELEVNGYFCRVGKAKNCQEFLSNSLQEAMKKLINDRGPRQEEWEWGQVHKTVFKAEVFSEVKSLRWIWDRSISTPGGLYTINVGTYRPHDFQQTNGPSYRQIIDLSNLKNSVYMQTLGQSGDPFSFHYSDLLRKWRDGEYLQMHLKRVGREEKLVLVPNV